MQKKELTLEDLRQAEDAFMSDRASRIMQLACSKSPIHSVVYDPNRRAKARREFSVEIKTMDATNQKSSGRCWLFAGCNLLREMVAKKTGVERFELSQSYLAFYDKLEKANFVMETLIDLIDRDRDDRTIARLLDWPAQDGGQWDMFRSLIHKYGVVPKGVMEEGYTSSNTRDVSLLINSRIRAFAAESRRMWRDGRKTEIRPLKEKIVGDIYRVMLAAYGCPPRTFDFEYTDKDGTYHIEKGLTPLSFYEKYVGAEIDEYVSVIHSPTQDKPFHRTYTVDYLGNVVGGEPVKYLNLPMNELKAAVVRSLKEGEPVWFGSDCSKCAERDDGVWDDEQFDYETAFGFSIILDKADGLDYGESAMNHAMLLTGVNLDGDTPNRWKVENSWGTDVADKGYYVATDGWFDRYVYQVVVRKAFLTEPERKELELEPRHLPLWDPMGTLAD